MNCAGKSEVMFAEDTTEAKAVCTGCPLLKKCLGVALDNDIGYGVWGGKDLGERTRMCPICRAPKLPEDLGCNGAHSLARLARLVELQAGGDQTISVSSRSVVTAPTSPGCVQLRGRSHSTAKAYKQGCRCAAARAALHKERVANGFNEKRRRGWKQPESIGRTARERFMAFVEISEEGHWIWTGATNGSGYGNFWDGSGTVRAHLFAARAFPAPDLFRECSERSCVNPAHRESARRAA